jgi:hypothetical protein
MRYRAALLVSAPATEVDVYTVAECGVRLGPDDT